MKTIIAGSRTINSINQINKAIKESGFTITEVVSGTARGADLLGEVWANNNKVPIKRFPANWDKYGKSAGYRRNEEMANYADACIVVWDGESKGSKHMIDIAKNKNLKLFVLNLKLEST
jgi:predicted double-glycine peptidase